MESQIPECLLHLPQAADVLAGLLLIQAIDQGKLPGRGGGGLDLVQVGGVLPQEFPVAGSSSVSSRWRYQALLRWKDLRGSRASRRASVVSHKRIV